MYRQSLVKNLLYKAAFSYVGFMAYDLDLCYNDIMKKIILASSSPRRIEMIKNRGFDPAVMPASIDETLPMSMSPEASVMYLAFKKASSISDQLSSNDTAKGADALIIAADTIVSYAGRVIGKPKNSEDAFETLSALRNNRHDVITGVCLLGSPRNEKLCLYEKTAVFFKDYSDQELRAYVNTAEPYDKAGGYAIQQTFKKYIHHIEGDLDNVVGLPWYRIESFLKD